MTSQRAIVTGGSAGIGQSLSIQLAYRTAETERNALRQDYDGGGLVEFL